MNPETVLITGASSGIGLELARIFAGEKCRLVLVARNAQKLEELAATLRAECGATVEVFPTDLAQRGASEKLMRQLGERGMVVDVLVNNAGFGAHGFVTELELARQLEMIQLNVAALTELTGRLLPGMVERKRGGVLNLASTAAFQPGPMMAVYFATKAYVLSFSEALSEELIGTGVTSTCVCPGPTITNFATVAGMENSLLFRFGAMGAEVVARAGHDAFRRRKVLCVPGLLNWLMAFSVRFTPRRLVRRIAKLINS